MPQQWQPWKPTQQEPDFSQPFDFDQPNYGNIDPYFEVQSPYGSNVDPGFTRPSPYPDFNDPYFERRNYGGQPSVDATITAPPPPPVPDVTNYNPTNEDLANTNMTPSHAFDSMTGITRVPTPSWNQPEEDPGLQSLDLINKYYKPQNVASSRLDRLVEGYPERERPSLGRTIVASGVALGPAGYKGAMEIMERPHQQRMADWNAQINPAIRSADIERASNANERQLAIGMATRAETERKNRALEEAREVRNKTDRLKAEGWKRIEGTGNTVWFGRTVDGVFEKMDSGISNRLMNEADKLAKLHDYRVDEMGRRHEYSTKLLELREAAQKRVKAAPSATSGVNKPETQFATTQRRYNNALLAQEFFPEAADWVKAVATGKGYDIKPDSAGTFGWGADKLDPETRRRLTDFILNNGAPSSGESPIDLPNQTGSQQPAPGPNRGPTGIEPQAPTPNIPGQAPDTGPSTQSGWGGTYENPASSFPRSQEEYSFMPPRPPSFPPDMPPFKGMKRNKTSGQMIEAASWDGVTWYPTGK